MNAWPVDDRDNHTTGEGKGKRRSSEKDTPPRNYPHLAQGSNLVKLIEKDGRMEWASIVKNGVEGHFFNIHDYYIIETYQSKVMPIVFVWASQR